MKKSRFPLILHFTFFTFCFLFFIFIFIFSTLVALQKPLSSSSHLSLSASNSNASILNGENDDIPLRAQLKVTPRGDDEVVGSGSEVVRSAVVPLGDTRDARLDQYLSDVSDSIKSLGMDDASKSLSISQFLDLKDETAV